MLRTGPLLRKFSNEATSAGPEVEGRITCGYERLFVGHKCWGEMLAVTVRHFRNAKVSMAVGRGHTDKFSLPYGAGHACRGPVLSMRTASCTPYGRRNELILFDDVDINARIEVLAGQHMGRRGCAESAESAGDRAGIRPDDLQNPGRARET